jgi:DNA-binding HxlR family transcriptional regulator
MVVMTVVKAATYDALDWSVDNCPIGRAMEILGERWTFLILHEAFHGVRRFSEMQRNLGIARNILSARLQLLVRTGILEKRRYQEEPERFEYRLSAMGRALYPAVVAITRWGEEYLVDDAAARPILRHRCGHAADPILVCAHCGEELDPRAVTPEPATTSV